MKKAGTRISREDKENRMLKWYKDRLYMAERNNPPDMEEVNKLKHLIELGEKRKERRIKSEDSKIHLTPKELVVLEVVRKKMRNKNPLTRDEVIFINHFLDVKLPIPTDEIKTQKKRILQIKADNTSGFSSHTDQIESLLANGKPMEYIITKSVTYNLKLKTPLQKGDTLEINFK